MIRDMIRFHDNNDPKPLSAAQRSSPGSAIAAARKGGGFVWIGLEDRPRKR